MERETFAKPVDEYIDAVVVRADDGLDAALAASVAAGLPSIQVTASQGKLLHLMARAQSARFILEIGTLGGYSAIWLARALPDGGRLVTLEADPRHADVAQANIARAGLEQLVDVRVGLAQDTLPQLRDEGAGPFDFIFIDADKTGYPSYLDWSLRLGRRGTVIVADNVVRHGEVADAANDDANVKAVRRYLELAAAEPRLDTTVIQTVGGKGWDGFAMSLITADA